MKNALKKTLFFLLSINCIASNTNTNSLTHAMTLDADDAGQIQYYNEEDFENSTSFNQFAQDHPEMIQQQSTQNTFITRVPPVKKNVSASKELDILNLAYTEPVQKVYVGSTYAYVLQHRTVNNQEQTVLTRCVLQGSSASRIDEMTLKGFAHDQSLEWFSHNGIPYFWTTCKKTTAISDYQFGIQIARIRYQPGKTINNYTDVVRLSNLDYAANDGKSFGTTKRVEFSLSSNYSNLMIWVQRDSKKTTGNILYAYYDNEKLNNLLDAKENQPAKYLEIYNAKSALIGYQKGLNSSDLPYGRSNQGLEFTDAQSVYIDGGKSGELPQFVKQLKTSGPNASKVVNYTESMRLNITHPNFTGTQEAEGIQLKGNKVFITVSDRSKTRANGRTIVYSIPKSSFD